MNANDIAEKILVRGNIAAHPPDEVLCPAAREQFATDPVEAEHPALLMMVEHALPEARQISNERSIEEPMGVEP